MNNDQLIQQNIVRHAKIAHAYDDRHSEIVNNEEQERLRTQLSWVVEQVRTLGTAENRQMHVLDFGCGTGNLTRHFLALGCQVTASDVTPEFLDLVSKRYPHDVTTHRLNGKDLSEIEDNVFDVVATYSVLHHVPDYLAAVRELVRVTRPGGIVVIDHEAGNEHWENSATLRKFRNLVTITKPASWYISQLLSFRWWIKRFRKTVNPRYSEEGDIHVWPDDHIEWEKIRSVFAELGVTPILDKDYLLANPQYAASVYEEYKTKCSDTHVLIGRKNSRA